MLGHHIRVEQEPLAREVELPEPGLRVHRLAQAAGERSSNKLPNCAKCKVSGQCIASVVELGPMARDECEMALAVMTDPERTVCELLVVGIGSQRVPGSQ